MNKKFGYGNILGEPDLTVLFEFENINENLAVGEDLITGLPLMSTYSFEHKCDIITPESNELSKKGFIHVQYYEPISRKQMIEYLRRMSDADLEMYKDRMNQINTRLSNDSKKKNL